MCYDYNKLLADAIGLFINIVIMFTIIIFIGVSSEAMPLGSLVQMSVEIRLSFTSVLLFRRWIEYTR